MIQCSKEINNYLVNLNQFKFQFQVEFQFQFGVYSPQLVFFTKIVTTLEISCLFTVVSLGNHHEPINLAKPEQLALKSSRTNLQVGGRIKRRVQKSKQRKMCASQIN